MKPYMVSRCGFFYLFILNIILLTSNDAKPLLESENPFKIKLNGTKSKKITLPHGRVSNEPKQLLQLLGKRKGLKASSNAGNRDGNKLYKIEPRRGGINEKTVKEWTISVPRFKQDEMGNWVYNPWGVTFGKVWEDTRFNIGHDPLPKMKRESSIARDYYPYDGTLPTVCFGRSTVYNRPRVVTWIVHHMYKYAHDKGDMVIMKNLRRTMRDKGNPEECHTANFTQFREFQECSTRRHQRLESLIPKYPRQQIPRS